MDDDDFLTQLIFSFDSSLKARKKTFSNRKLPFKSPTVDALLDAGFFYLKEDSVQCWACAIVLDGWEPDDDPLEEHKKHSPDCPSFNLSSRNNPTLEEYLEIRLARFKSDILKNYFPYAQHKLLSRLQGVTDEVLGVSEKIKKEKKGSLRTSSRLNSSNH
ncbi:hypothetical protein LOD99_7894 [Oopsacas minuta]|uniref:Uncharacterized protein n=1 Tax=Oopsacas minuta TaxID=111878 RepID=A0AAV7JIX3_9METZ|nr:hypothetical protein LOD99_7894 [Oopsacas minuta]